MNDTFESDPLTWNWGEAGRTLRVLKYLVTITEKSRCLFDTVY